MKFCVFFAIFCLYLAGVSAFRLNKSWNNKNAQTRQGIIDVTVLQPRKHNNASEGGASESQTKTQVPVRIVAKRKRKLTNAGTNLIESGLKSFKAAADMFNTIKNAETQKTLLTNDDEPHEVTKTETLTEKIASVEPVEHVLEKQPVKETTTVFETTSPTEPLLTTEQVKPLGKNPFEDLFGALNTDHQETTATQVFEHTPTSVPTLVETPTKLVGGDAHFASHYTTTGALGRADETVVGRPLVGRTQEHLMDMINELKRTVEQIQVSSEIRQLVNTLSTTLLHSISMNRAQDDSRISLQYIEDAVKNAISKNTPHDRQALDVLKNAFVSVMHELQPNNQRITDEAGWRMSNADDMLNRRPLSPTTIVLHDSRRPLFDDTARPTDERVVTEVTGEHTTTTERLPTTVTERLPTVANSLHSNGVLATDRIDEPSRVVAAAATPLEGTRVEGDRLSEGGRLATAVDGGNMVERLEKVKSILDEITDLAVHHEDGRVVTTTTGAAATPVGGHNRIGKTQIRVKFVDLSNRDAAHPLDAVEEHPLPVAPVVSDDTEEPAASRNTISKAKVNKTKAKPKKHAHHHHHHAANKKRKVPVIIARNAEDRSKIIASIFGRAIRQILATAQQKN